MQIQNKLIVDFRISGKIEKFIEISSFCYDGESLAYLPSDFQLNSQNLLHETFLKVMRTHYSFPFWWKTSSKFHLVVVMRKLLWGMSSFHLKCFHFLLHYHHPHRFCDELKINLKLKNKHLFILCFLIF